VIDLEPGREQLCIVAEGRGEDHLWIYLPTAEQCPAVPGSLRNCASAARERDPAVTPVLKVYYRWVGGSEILSGTTLSTLRIPLSAWKWTPPWGTKLKIAGFSKKTPRKPPATTGLERSHGWRYRTVQNILGWLVQKCRLPPQSLETGRAFWACSLQNYVVFPWHQTPVWGSKAH
jgi:hypothetical protein